MKVDSRDLSLVAIYASLYAVLVYIFAPISFFALQFRVAGVIRPAIARKWMLSIGYSIGVVVGNLFSPFIGSFELVFMPVMSLLAGLLGNLVARKFNGDYFVAGIVIAMVIALSVSWMLNQLFNIPMLATFFYLFVSEQAVCFLGAFIFKLIEKRFKWW
ncbi:MAG: QueT transporter family protein [Candidatus Bathyarchaeota archaeon]